MRVRGCAVARLASPSHFWHSLKEFSELGMGYGRRNVGAPEVHSGRRNVEPIRSVCS